MDEWRIQQQQHHRMLSGGVGPVLSYHSIRSRASPYPSPHQMSELKQSYQYPQNSSTTSANPLSPANVTSSPNPNAAQMCIKNDSDDNTSSSSDEVSTTTTTTSNPVSFFKNKYLTNIYKKIFYSSRMFILLIIQTFHIHLHKWNKFNNNNV